LIDIEGHRGVLTAKHVADCLKYSEKIGLVFSSNLHGCEIEKNYIQIINVQGSSLESKDLDLSIIIIPDNFLGTIRAHKSFFNISLHRNTILQSSVVTNDGIWALCGLPGEYETTEEPQQGFDVVYVYTFSCIFMNKIENEYRCDEYDLLTARISYDNADRTVVPDSFGGVSGGGLWKFELYRVDGRSEVRNNMLLGVAFYQTALNDNTRYIRFYGWNSIYKTAYNAVISKFS
jgi:hypothetical protein